MHIELKFYRDVQHSAPQRNSKLLVEFTISVIKVNSPLYKLSRVYLFEWEFALHIFWAMLFVLND